MNPSEVPVALASASSHSAPKGLDPIQLMMSSSGVVLVVLLLLIAASTLVWLIWILKSAQLGRLSAAQHKFEVLAERVSGASDLVHLAQQHLGAPGARVVLELAKHQHLVSQGPDYLISVAKRAIATEHQRAASLMPTLQSIASASPFVGLFGTVWGIMDAFLRIGMEKSASLPVVAPAIGEALIATAFGLVAAIPATIGFNYVDRRIGDLLEELEASAESWSRLFAGSASRAAEAFGRGGA
jgi:biopolymer transport protein TolQ